MKLLYSETDFACMNKLIEVKSADKMTENQRQAFVKEFFSISG